MLVQLVYVTIVIYEQLKRGYREMIYSITEIESRYQETDQMGVIYHGNYPTWFEVARTDYISKLGFSYKEMEDSGVISPVTDIEIVNTVDPVVANSPASLYISYRYFERNLVYFSTQVLIFTFSG